MDQRSVQISTVAIATFIPWIITLATLGAVTSFAHPLFLAIHYAITVLLFAVAFSIYYKGHKHVNPFEVMGIAVLSWLVFEGVYYGFIYTGDFWFLTYLDWFVPLFLLAGVVYGVGRLEQRL